MIDKDILRQLVKRQKKALFPKGEFVKRDLLDGILNWFKDNRVIILTGIRRCGKSTLLKEIMQNMHGWCYVDFEDERFLDFRAQDFEALNEVLIEVYGNVNIYFFDEVQNIEKFETFVRRLQDEGKKVVITGSNASLLSKEFGTRLTGRYKPFEVYPFSFREFLKFKKARVEKDDFYIAEKKVGLAKLFEEYLLSGGLPEYLKNKDKEYVRTVYENILYKDVIARYAIRRQKVIKELINILATNISSQFTYNSLKRALGLGNSITVKEYISYLNNSYLFFELLKFSYSIRQQLNSPRKIYLVDSAFNQVCGINFSQNKGKILENAVFVELKRRNKEAYYYSNKNECDFIIKGGTRITEAIQVCYVLDDASREREINGLLEAMDKFKLKEGIILTREQTEEITRDGKKIQIMPVFRWLVE
ncbi:ATP-binding protein [Candidatus Woesearchaeota archaeon]|nr:ATP-binding protein [Candidatus Woesearchaeota archaeon]